MRNILPAPEFEPQTVQLVPSMLLVRATEWVLASNLASEVRIPEVFLSKCWNIISDFVTTASHHLISSPFFFISRYFTKTSVGTNVVSYI
jgi:hypothetical protein